MRVISTLIRDMYNSLLLLIKSKSEQILKVEEKVKINQRALDSQSKILHILEIKFNNNLNIFPN